LNAFVAFEFVAFGFVRCIRIRLSHSKSFVALVLVVVLSLQQFIQSNSFVTLHSNWFVAFEFVRCISSGSNFVIHVAFDSVRGISAGSSLVMAAVRSLHWNLFVAFGFVRCINVGGSFVMAPVLALVFIKIMPLVLALALPMVVVLVLALSLVLTLVIGSPRMPSIVEHWAAFEFVHWADRRIRSLGSWAQPQKPSGRTKTITNECQAVLHGALVTWSRGRVTGQRWHPYGRMALTIAVVEAAVLALVLE